ncbi:MAG TPA: MBL fold metallo-hydrolase [Ktedonobacterales bacterium]|nr:MBL fold metallo-hydrolase [Ktedonobacterales bacterium]
MEAWICVTCGSQFTPSQEPPPNCPICLDQRQYIGHEGQRWTTLGKMQQDGYQAVIKQEEPALMGIGTTPSFAIGQRALLVQTKQGNVLWDCITFLDEKTVQAVQDLGGIAAIAISHPHYYSSMIEWAERFQAPVYLHAADRQWVMRPDERINFWSGETLALPDGLTLVRLGGHFAGGTVLHWPQGAEGRGVLLAGDIINVVADRAWVSFMYSFPNLIPLPAREIRRIRETIAPYPFDRLYSAWFERVVSKDASQAVQRSAERYIKAVEEGLEPAL